jgi:hypothetical protein
MSPPRRWPQQLAAMALAAAATAAAAAANDSPATPAPRRHDMTSKDLASASAARRSGHKTFTTEQLVPLLRVQLGDWKRDSLEKPKPRRLAGRVSALSAEYSRANASASVGVNDAGEPSTVVAKWTGGPVERQVEGGHEKSYKADGRVVTETFRDASHEASVVVTLANGVSIVAMSQTADSAALKALIDAMDLASAEALKR